MCLGRPQGPGGELWGALRPLTKGWLEASRQLAPILLSVGLSKNAGEMFFPQPLLWEGGRQRAVSTQAGFDRESAHRELTPPRRGRDAVPAVQVAVSAPRSSQHWTPAGGQMRICSGNYYVLTLHLHYRGSFR